MAGTQEKYVVVSAFSKVSFWCGASVSQPVDAIGRGFSVSSLFHHFPLIPSGVWGPLFFSVLFSSWCSSSSSRFLLSCHLLSLVWKLLICQESPRLCVRPGQAPESVYPKRQLVFLIVTSENGQKLWLIPFNSWLFFQFPVPLLERSFDFFLHAALPSASWALAATKLAFFVNFFFFFLASFSLSNLLSPFRQLKLMMKNYLPYVFFLPYSFIFYK